MYAQPGIVEEAGNGVTEYNVVCSTVGVVPEVKKRMAVGAGDDEHRSGSPAAVDLELGVDKDKDEEEKGPDVMCGKVSYAILWYSSVSAGVNRAMTKPSDSKSRARARAALAGSLNSTNECEACLTSDEGSEDV